MLGTKLQLIRLILPSNRVTKARAKAMAKIMIQINKMPRITVTKIEVEITKLRNKQLIVAT